MVFDSHWGRRRATAADGTKQLYGLPAVATSWRVKQGWMCCLESKTRMLSTGFVDHDRAFQPTSVSAPADVAPMFPEPVVTASFTRMSPDVTVVRLIVSVVVLPAVVYLLRGVLNAANSIVPSVDRIAAIAHAGSADLDAVPLLLTTQDQVIKTIESAANYGGSLDVIVDDA